MKLLRLATMLVAASVWACGTDAGVAYVVFEGHRYSGGGAGEFEITPADLSRAGEASEIQAQVRGQTVYRLAGVDSDAVIFMESATPSARYFIFFRAGMGQAGVPMSEVVPGLCQYLVVPPSGGCSLEGPTSGVPRPE